MHLPLIVFIVQLDGFRVNLFLVEDPPENKLYVNFDTKTTPQIFGNDSTFSQIPPGSNIIVHPEARLEHHSHLGPCLMPHGGASLDLGDLVHAELPRGLLPWGAIQ